MTKITFPNGSEGMIIVGALDKSNLLQGNAIVNVGSETHTGKYLNSVPQGTFIKKHKKNGIDVTETWYCLESGEMSCADEYTCSWIADENKFKLTSSNTHYRNSVTDNGQCIIDVTCLKTKKERRTILEGYFDGFLNDDLMLIPKLMSGMKEIVQEDFNLAYYGDFDQNNNPIGLQIIEANYNGQIVSRFKGQYSKADTPCYLFGVYPEKLLGITPSELKRLIDVYRDSYYYGKLNLDQEYEDPNGYLFKKYKNNTYAVYCDIRNGISVARDANWTVEVDDNQQMILYTKSINGKSSYGLRRNQQGQFELITTVKGNKHNPIDKDKKNAFILLEEKLLELGLVSEKLPCPANEIDPKSQWRENIFYLLSQEINEEQKVCYSKLKNLEKGSWREIDRKCKINKMEVHNKMSCKFLQELRNTNEEERCERQTIIERHNSEIAYILNNHGLFSRESSQKYQIDDSPLKPGEIIIPLGVFPPKPEYELWSEYR